MEFYELPPTCDGVRKRKKTNGRSYYFSPCLKDDKLLLCRFFLSFSLYTSLTPSWSAKHQKWFFIHNSMELNGLVVVCWWFNEVIIYFLCPQVPPTVWWCNDLSLLCRTRFLMSIQSLEKYSGLPGILKLWAHFLERFIINIRSIHGFKGKISFVGIRKLAKTPCLMNR